MTKKMITGAGGPEGATPERIVNSALEMLSVRAWPGPERNTRIEDYLMSQTKTGRSLSRKKLWLGGLMVLLCGTAIGAVTTRMAIYRFTGEAVDADGNRYTVEGEMQIEEAGDEKTVYMTMDGIPDVQIENGELTLEDGRKVQIVPVEGGGASVTTTVSGEGPVDPEKAAEAVKQARQQLEEQKKTQAKPDQPK